MEAASFDVPAFSFVEITPSGPAREKHILVPGPLLPSDGSDVVALKRLDSQPKLAQKISALVPIKVNLGDFQLLNQEVPERIFAHAVARCHHTDLRSPVELSSTDRDQLIDYRVGNQFFIMNEFCQQAKHEKSTKVVNLSTGEIGLVPSVSLMFYPHAKVVEEFEWTLLGEKKVLNRVGDFFTIAHGTWVMNWTPEGKATSKRYPFTFGRNRRTGYSGLIRVQTIAELDPSEIDTWRRSNLLPPSCTSHAASPKRKRICSHFDEEDCSRDYQQKTGVVDEFKRTRGIQDFKATVPKWRQLDGIYKIPASMDGSGRSLGWGMGCFDSGV